MHTVASQAHPGQPGVLLGAIDEHSVLHTPQSFGQVPQCSVLSHLLLPQTGRAVGAQTPQSSGHALQVSVAPHLPSPQPTASPQSCGHTLESSESPQSLSPQASGLVHIGPPTSVHSCTQALSQAVEQQ